MTPDQICSFLCKQFPELTSKIRANPDGWSFFLGPARGGQHSTRILRAVRNNPKGLTLLKLSVSSRMGANVVEENFNGDEAALQIIVENEILLFRTHFSTLQ